MNGFDEIDNDVMREIPEEFKNCIVGYCIKSNLPIYSMSKIARVIQKRGVNYHEALDIFNKTFKQNDLGENEPIYCDDLDM
jgi:hypothetical protein